MISVQVDCLTRRFRMSSSTAVNAETGVKMTTLVHVMTTMMMTMAYVTFGDSSLVWHAGNVVTHLLSELDRSSYYVPLYV